MSHCGGCGLSFGHTEGCPNALDHLKLHAVLHGGMYVTRKAARVEEQQMRKSIASPFGHTVTGFDSEFRPIIETCDEGKARDTKWTTPLWTSTALRTGFAEHSTKALFTLRMYSSGA